MAGKSRVNREVQARFCERLGVKFPGATRPEADIWMHHLSGNAVSQACDLVIDLKFFPSYYLANFSRYVSTDTKI